MPAAAWPLPEPGPESFAFRLLRGMEVNDRLPLVHWRNWLDLSVLPDPGWLFKVTEDSMRMRNGEVLSLIWFDDEAALEIFLEQLPPYRRRLVGERG